MHLMQVKRLPNVVDLYVVLYEKIWWKRSTIVLDHVLKVKFIADCLLLFIPYVNLSLN